MYASVGALGRLGTTGTWNQAILGISPREGRADDRFLGYWLAHLKPTLASLFRSNTQANLNAEQVANLPFTDTSFEDQRRIADFLDAETARVDRLIRLREEQVKLQDARVLGIIAKALFGGASCLPRQATGLPWMPTIPESWRLGPVYAYFDVRLGKMLNPERVRGAHPRPYLRNANVHWFSRPLMT